MTDEQRAENLALYERYRTPPKEALKEITGGRLKGMTDISPMWRIQALTEAFGACGAGWWLECIERWTEDFGEEMACFVTLALYYRYKTKEGEERRAVIQGTGGAMLLAKEKNGLHADDEAYKKAWTDAISSCCKQLGIGADVYWGAGSKYTTTEKTIHPSLVEKLRAKFIEYKIDEKAVCERYGLQKLDDLTDEKYKALYAEWDEVRATLSGLNG